MVKSSFSRRDVEPPADPDRLLRDASPLWFLLPVCMLVVAVLGAAVMALG